jgi:hypothetical protein
MSLQVSLEALWWVVLHNLTPLNYVLALEASIWFIERAAMEHPKDKVGTKADSLHIRTCMFQLLHGYTRVFMASCGPLGVQWCIIPG